MKPQLDWASLPKPFNWKTNQPDPQPDITVATVFGQRYAASGLHSYICGKLGAKPYSMQLCKVANMDQGLACPSRLGHGHGHSGHLLCP